MTSTPRLSAIARLSACLSKLHGERCRISPRASKIEAFQDELESAALAPPAVGPLSPEDRAFLNRDVDAHRVAVRLNLANADRWYRALLYRLPHLDLVMPWRPMLDHLFDDGPTGPNRAHGLRTAEAAAARCDIVLALVKQTPGMLREAAACVGTGGRLVSLEQLGAAPPATWPSDDDLPAELRS